MNFILRTINEESGVVYNMIIGNSYEAIKRQNLTDNKWFERIKLYYPKINIKDIKSVRAIVLYSESILIFKFQKAYIMTENGATFEQII